jgi:O-antigen biosynthesis protein
MNQLNEAVDGHEGSKADQVAQGDGTHLRSGGPGSFAHVGGAKEPTASNVTSTSADLSVDSRKVPQSETVIDLFRHMDPGSSGTSPSGAAEQSLDNNDETTFRLDPPVKSGWYRIVVEAMSDDTARLRVQVEFADADSRFNSVDLKRIGNSYAYEGRFLSRLPFIALRLNVVAGSHAVHLRSAKILKLTKRRRFVGLFRSSLQAAAWRPTRFLSLWKSYSKLKRSKNFFDLGRFWQEKNATDVYAAWIKQYDYDDAIDRTRLTARIAELSTKPLISVVMPVYDTPKTLLDTAVQSVIDQVYPHWELCIANDGSRAPHVAPQLDSWAACDPRIKVVHLDENGHISRATNAAFALAGGDWVALLDHDDVLPPNALAEVALTLEARPDAALIYSDEDKIDEKARRFDPHFKPNFSPELFRSMNYLNHLTLLPAELVRAVGGWRPGFEGSQDYDIALRIIERIAPAQIVHIPKVLYHWRAVAGSTALAGAEKSYAYQAGARALAEHIARTGQNAQVVEIPGLPFYRVRHEVTQPEPLVSLIIPTRDRVDLLKVAVRSILEKTSYRTFEIIIMDNNSVLAETSAFFKEIASHPNVRVIPHPHPFNYSSINNEGVRHARGEIIGLLNNDVEVISPDWLTEMVSWAQIERVGCVGAKLYYLNDTIQHAGVILGIGGVAGHSHRRMRRDQNGYFSRLKVVQNLSAVTGACLLVRRSVFQQVGGLDEVRLKVAFNDVDFCLRVRDAGYDNVWTPFAELYHHESPSRGAEDTPQKKARFAEECAAMIELWGPKLLADPYYSANLTLQTEDFAIAR